MPCRPRRRSLACIPLLATVLALLLATPAAALPGSSDATAAVNPRLAKRAWSAPSATPAEAKLALLQLSRRKLPASTLGPMAGGSSAPPAAPPSNDSCATPVVLAGSGTFAFDNSNATTGTQGQSGCQLIGLAHIDHDLWYEWTAPATGCVEVRTCGLTAVDTKIAAYLGAGCPGALAIACNDDMCGLQSVMRWSAVAGTTYTIQIGTFPGASGGPGSFTVAQGTPTIGNDECTSPAVVLGLGVFPFDNSLATTSCIGQLESLCAAQYGQSTIDNDLWFQWTAPSTGTAVCDTCGLTSVDTKIAVYAGVGCPVQGSALACIDDSCPGFQATLDWPCTAGATYTIQLGTFPGASGGPGSFSLDVLALPANDECSAPQALGPSGPYPFALFGATTGTRGQHNTSTCGWFGLTGIEDDIWFTWVAPASGRANWSLCAGANFDSKIAVYHGGACPLDDTAIACNDDSCGLTSQVCFDVVAGDTYLLQLGSFPGAGNNFAGSFDLSVAPPLAPCTWDDGSTENLLGWAAGGDLVWLDRFGAVGQSTVVDSIDVLWGSALFPGYNPASNGQFAADLFVWQDGASQDGDPSDATLLLQVPHTISVWDTDTYVHVPIAPLVIDGVFFVGAHQETYGFSGVGPVQFVAPMDQNCPTPGVAWFFGNNSGYGTSPVDYAHPQNNVQPPQSFFSVGFPCQVCVRAGCSSGPASYLCDAGSGGVIACPCANPPGGPMRGCDNSSATGGASIGAAGSNSIGNPTLSFHSTGEPSTAVSMLLQGTNAVATGLVFGQGVRCVAGSLRRLYLKTAIAGGIRAPDFATGDPDIPARSAQTGDPLAPGSSRWYLVYYRDPIVLGSCPSSSTFNVTNTAAVDWQP